MLIGALLAVSVAGSVQVGGPSEPPGCAVLYDHISAGLDEDDARGSPHPVIDPRAPPAVPGTVDSIAGRFQSAPPRALIAALLEAQPYRSPVAECPTLVSMLDARGVEHSTEAIDAVVVRPSEPRVGPLRSVETYALPVVSADGREALTQNILVASSLVVYGYFHFRREGDHWVRVGSAIMGSTTLRWPEEPASDGGATAPASQPSSPRP